MLSRKTLCLASQAPGFTLHDGDDLFLKTISNHYSSAENDAAEKLMELKRTVATLATPEFWRVLLPGIANILQSEYVIVAKRILPDDPNSVVEMPAIGEPGNCVNAVAMYINDGKSEGYYDDYQYATYGGACAQMRHDKVFLAPDSLAEYMPTRLVDMKVHPESYIGIPLFHREKCFGHIAVIWSDVSTFKNSGLTWGFVEMILHSLEDITASKLLEGSTLKPPSPVLKNQQIIPQSAIAVAQSMKPYARSLSHELRTPMQTMVGGMDLLSASLDDILNCDSLEDALAQVKKAKEMIDEFQDSSRRAVRAADNVVQAYDLNMQVPDGRLLLEDELDVAPPPPEPLLLEQTSADYANYAAKRKREGPEIQERAEKSRTLNGPRSAPSNEVDSHTAPNNQINGSGDHHILGESTTSATHSRSPTASIVGLVQLRKFITSEIRELVNDVESRPTQVTVTVKELGEKVNVSTVSPSGNLINKSVCWEVQPSVPAEIVIEEKELSKTFTALVANALKFTDDGGHIKIDVRLSPRLRYVVFTVKDNGRGIPESFQPKLFKAFAREDDSITRHNEGLGLGLLVAKGNARKLNGDIYLIRSATEGPGKGSHFELKIPLDPFEMHTQLETPSRPQTPSRFDVPSTPFDFEASSKVAKKDTIDLKLSLDQAQALSVTPAQLLTPGSPTERAKSAKQSFNRQLGLKYPHRILVAEDSSLNRKLAVNMLQKLGYINVLEAFDGKEAVRLMEQALTNDERIDMILMDLWMPNMDGYEAAQRILEMHREQQKVHDLKILAITADITDAALDRAKEVGMVGYMTKPFKVIELQRLIVEHSQPCC